MGEQVLVTGGAGFIGSFLVDRLVKAGHRVTVLDNLDPQVHPTGQWPTHINPEAEYIQGDVRDLDRVRSCLAGVSVIFHQAAAVGVSQSQQQVRHYVDVNNTGTATLYQALIDSKAHPRRIVVAGSMSSFGEGTYQCDACGPVRPTGRSAEQLAAHRWDPPCPRCGGRIRTTPITEADEARPASIYAFSKKLQEDTALNMASTYGWPTVVLRYFNAYGPRQALGNPYTGVLAIFINRLLNDQPPLVYEDGLMLRDFVSVHDLVNANMLAMECDLPAGSCGELFNIGSGQPISIAAIARLVSGQLLKRIEPEVLGKYRVGDVRHCYADIAKAQKLLGYQPAHRLEDGLLPLIQWARQAPRQADRLGRIVAEFASEGLVR